MQNKISTTFLFTMVFAIVPLFAATQILAADYTPQPDVQFGTHTEIYTDTNGRNFVAIIKRDGPSNNQLDVKIIQTPSEKAPGFREFKPSLVKWDKFQFCEEDTGGSVTIGKTKYSCHETHMVKDKSFLIGNPYCPYFLNPPGILINLCPY